MIRTSVNVSDVTKHTLMSASLVGAPRTGVRPLSRVSSHVSDYHKPVPSLVLTDLTFEHPEPRISVTCHV